ncbi:TIR domain-containing protein [Chryseotalea sanaruensis]|uniref:TIR domain-containing protein n=1 Tax=Chryseotalea sanaruensis TaxID=2482724 RepID=A0A401UD49_9BACT|nr:toll/interleukin-1 receptor domain-containing protein [Chryseotalea sanaruensis]GCC52804.1 TIR domain-containing protein [Chryseotalea sanaruensis]
MSYKTPLAVYIIWHPDYLEGQQMADYLYSVLCRNPDKPLVRALSIPVYFRSKNKGEESSPIEIDFNESEYTAVIPLITDDFVNDKNYGNYLDQIHDVCNTKKNKRRVYPVALSKAAFNVSAKLSSINFIRINKNKDGCDVSASRSTESQIKSHVLHELCRLLMNMKKASEETDSLTVSPPVKLFISHSKHDESKLDAIKFRDYINSQTQLKTFFDANDIAYGSNFGEEIKKAASESALVVFQSDSYADREWCRIEVLTAKSEGCPIVIVNAVQNGEKRAFPYLGNNPSIRFKENFQEIIDLTLEQVLFNKYTRNYLDSLTDLYNIRTDRILSNVPELFNFIQLRKQKITKGEKYALVIYPDPPLGTEEMDILNQLDDDFVFITPLMLPSIAKRNEQKI